MEGQGGLGGGQVQVPDFNATDGFTCHCHDDCAHPLRVFILYDNACNALKYALNRAPETVEETIWLVDKLHWANHNVGWEAPS